MSDKPLPLPTSLPGGFMQPFMSKRRLQQQFDTVDEMLGGDMRLFDEANKNSDAYWEFKKLQAKMMPRESLATHDVSDGVEALLDKLDAAEREKTIEGSYLEVTDASEG
jgi:hypothetical protein